MKQPKVSIIILNWNGAEDTIECLESLKNVTYPNIQTIIVDNASSGNDVKILQERFGDFIHVIVNDNNYGFPEGCNIGMRYALQRGTDYFLMLNNDTIVDANFITSLVNVAESDQTIGVVGSKVYYYYSPNKIQYIGGKINWLLGLNNTHINNEYDHGQYCSILEQDYVPFTSSLIKKALVDEIGFLDPFYFFAIEEFDYCKRAKHAGFKVLYAPDSKIWHKWGASGSKLSDYPESLSIVREKTGIFSYKLWWRLYKTYSPPVLFIIPFLLQVSLIGPGITTMLRGQWPLIFSSLKRQIKLFSK